MKTHTILPAIFLALCTVLSAEPAKLEVHEWGTFTIVSGSDGQPIRWYQPRKTLVELPAFVILQGQSINSNFSSGSNPPSETVYVMTPRMNNGGSINGTNLVDQYAEGPLGLKSGWYTGATTKSDDTKILNTTTQDAAEPPGLKSSWYRPPAAAGQAQDAAELPGLALPQGVSIQSSLQRQNQFTNGESGTLTLSPAAADQEPDAAELPAFVLPNERI